MSTCGQILSSCFGACANNNPDHRCNRLCWCNYVQCTNPPVGPKNPQICERAEPRIAQPSVQNAWKWRSTSQGQDPIETCGCCGSVLQADAVQFQQSVRNQNNWVGECYNPPADHAQGRFCMQTAPRTWNIDCGTESDRFCDRACRDIEGLRRVYCQNDCEDDHEGRCGYNRSRARDVV